ncbi:hypothetical protein [Bacillus testis]|uniref:hypothetical protein n=1 Tax=Bacillus testis TaxID=1622072 RepID=UPI00067E935C|nr:hypothetical protein [Bacillus testis]
MKKKDIWQLVLPFITAIGAITAGFGLVSDPTGSSVGLPLSLLDGTVFSSYLIPGLCLLGIIGFGHLFVCFVMWKRGSRAWFYLGSVGIVLMGWIIIQVLLIGYCSPLQPIFLAVGLIELIGALLWKKRCLNKVKL